MLVWYPPLLVSKPLKKCKEKKNSVDNDRCNVIFWLKSCKIKVTGGRQENEKDADPEAGMYGFPAVFLLSCIRKELWQ